MHHEPAPTQTQHVHPRSDIRVQECLLRRLETVARTVGVTRLANITHLDVLGFPVWTAVRPDSRGLCTSQGKGLTNLEAKLGALMEAVETWHAEQCVNGLVFESAARLGAIAITADRIGLLPGVSLDPAEPQLWVEGFHLRSRRSVLLPWQAVSLNYVPSRERGHMLQSSSGLSGGNSLEDALLHALCEVVERDAITHWYDDPGGLAATRMLRLSALGGPLGEAVRRVQAHCHIGLWDITTEGIGVPTYACTLLDAGSIAGAEVGACSGFACHQNASVAALKAVLEAAQARATMISGNRDDLGYDQFKRSRDPTLNLQLRAAIDAEQERGLRDSLNLESEPVRALEQLLDHLEECGVTDVYGVNLTSPVHHIPVVKVLSPQMTHKGVTYASAVAMRKGRSTPQGGRQA